MRNLDGLKYDDDFLETTSKARFMKEKVDKLGFIKTKIYSMKHTVKEMKRQATECEKIFKNANDLSHKGLLSKIYKNS